MHKTFFVLFLVSTSILPIKSGHAQSLVQEPRVPCTGKVIPAYPSTDQTFATRIWTRDQIPSWVPPACMDWNTLTFDFMLAISGRFTNVDNVADFARRVVSFSTLTKMRYWSVSNDEWRPLFDDAGTLSNIGLESRRNDFTSIDVQSGAQFYYFQDESSPLGPVIFLMTIIERSPKRLIFTSINISPFQVPFFDAVKAGGFDQYYIIQKELGQTWTYYSLVRTKMSHAFLAPSTSSSLNRAFAYFRHIAGFNYESRFPFAKK